MDIVIVGFRSAVSHGKGLGGIGVWVLAGIAIIKGLRLKRTCFFSWRKCCDWGGGGEGDPQLRDLLIVRVSSSPTSNAVFEAVWEEEIIDHT